jgi:hypothetical protein
MAVELTIEQRRALALARARRARAEAEQSSSPPRFIEQRAQNTEEQRQQYAQEEGERLRQERYAAGQYGQRFITPEERRARAGAPAATTDDQAFRENIAAAGGVGSGLVSGALGLPADLVTLGGNILTLGAMGNPLEPITSAGIQESINQQLPEYLTDTRSFDPMSQFGQVFAPGTAVAKTVDIAAPAVSRVASNLYRGKGRVLAENLRRSAIEDIAPRASENRLRLADVLRQQQAAEAQPTFYSTRTPTEVGTELQGAARGNVANIERARSETDAALRQTRNEIVRQNEANGVFIDQTPAYEEIIRRTQPYVNERVYGPGLRPSVVPEIRNLYTRLNDAIRTRKIELDPDEARAAINAGAQDVEISGEKFYRTFRTSFDAIDELRRYFGQAFAQNAEGFKAIPNNVKQDFYRLIDEVQNQYVGSVQPELQTNWRRYTNQLNEFDTKLGKRLKKEGVLGSEIYKEIGKGSENIDRLIQQTGNPEAVKNAALDFFLNKIQTSSLGEAEKMLQPGDILFETLNNPNLADVKRAVTAAINDLRRKASRSEVSGNIAKRIEGQVPELRQLQTEIENLPIDKSLKKIEQYYEKYYPEGSEEYARVIQDINRAGSAMEKRKLMRNWFLTVAAGGVGASAYNAFIGD